MRRDCPEQQPGCPYFETGCYSDQHHLVWPSNEYTAPLEQVYRELPENKVQLCRFQHDLEHQLDPPIKPSAEVMRQAVETAVAVSGLYLSVNKRKKLGL